MSRAVSLSPSEAIYFAPFLYESALRESLLGGERGAIPPCYIDEGAADFCSSRGVFRPDGLPWTRSSIGRAFDS